MFRKVKNFEPEISEDSSINRGGLDLLGFEFKVAPGRNNRRGSSNHYTNHKLNSQKHEEMIIKVIVSVSDIE